MVKVDFIKKLFMLCPKLTICLLFRFWSWIELTIIVLSIGTIVMYIYRFLKTIEKTDQIEVSNKVD